MPDPVNASLSGEIEFFQHYLPMLEAGKYTVSVAQEVKLSAPKPVHETFINEVTFAVVSNRFSLEPALIDSMFPPANARGEYFNVLPHIVLTRRTLPWERSPLDAPPQLSDDIQDVAPWLALLVFDQDDPAPALANGTVHDLADLKPGTVSYPNLDQLEFGEAASEACQTIDVPMDVFRRIAPSLADLRWLAHVRRVSTAKKAGSPGADALTDYAVIIANRLPAMGKKSTVHLVSLHRLAGYLPGAASPPPAGVTTIRLVSLTRWSFDTVSEKQSFATVLEAVDVVPLALRPSIAGPSGAGASAAGPGDPATTVRNALAMGFVGLDHRLREGDRTVSWYRGPLLPYPAKATVKVPVSSADAVLRYDPATGVFDTSYAAAWQLGRLLALGSKGFSTDLVHWKQAARREAIAAAEQDMLQRRLGAVVALHDAGSILKATLPTLVGGAVTPLAVAQGPDAQPLAMPESVSAWFAQLRRLAGVPFGYLVPDQRMLPPESIRFFHLDANWITCLVDGAYGLGRATESDLALDHDNHRAAMAAGVAAAASPVTGLLLRSHAVTDWPGLEVTAYGKDSGEPLRLLRFDPLSPGVVIALFDGVATRIDLHEPPEGLHFGFDMPDKGDIARAAFFKKLRNPDDRNTLAKSSANAIYRDVGNGVVAIDALAQQMRADVGGTFTAAEFALEMIEGVGLVSFATGV